MLKLYKVKFTREILVLADNREDAKVMGIDMIHALPLSSDFSCHQHIDQSDEAKKKAFNNYECPF